VGRASNAWTVLVTATTSLGRHTGEGLFQFQPIIFARRPARKFLARKSLPCLKITMDNYGRAPRTDWRVGAERTGHLHDSRSLVVRAIAGCRGKSLGGNREPRVELFQGREIHLLSENGGRPAGNDISCLYLDKDGVLWWDFGHGLARHYQGKWQRYSTDDGLASNSIDYIIEDDEGCLWIAPTQV